MCPVKRSHRDATVRYLVPAMGPSDEALETGSAEHYPGSNPHPVIRISDDGRLTCANDASPPLLATVPT